MISIGKKNVCGIYKITSPSGKIYIGQSIDIKKRLDKYKNLNCLEQIKLYRSFVKYGIENHAFEIIEECDKSELNNKERFWQDYYNVLDDGLNCVLVNNDTEKQIFSKETRNKLSKIRKGKKLTEKHKQKISEGHKGIKHSEESKKKISETKSKMSEETKQKFGKLLKKYKESDVWKENFRNSKCKIILNLETGIFYFGTKEAAESIDINLGYFQNMISGNRRNKTSLIYV